MQAIRDDLAFMREMSVSDEAAVVDYLDAMERQIQKG